MLLLEIKNILRNVPSYIEDYCMRLNKMYIPTRYPDAWSEGIPEDQYSKSEAEEAIAMAEKVVNWVRETWESLRRELSREKST